MAYFPPYPHAPIFFIALSEQIIRGEAFELGEVIY